MKIKRRERKKEKEVITIVSIQEGVDLESLQ